MGFIKKNVRKLTGVSDQAEAIEANTAAQERATREASSRQTAQLQAAAKAAADQQSMLAARETATQAAADLASTPLGEAEVQLDANPTESAAGQRRTKRAAFGRGYTSSAGVSI